jgi:hypothetical protein
LEVLKVVVAASLDVPMDVRILLYFAWLTILQLSFRAVMYDLTSFQPLLPIRAEIDANLGGTQCNLMLSRLMSWMCLHSSRTKAMKLPKANSNQEISQTKESKPVMWICTVSAPEMTVMLYSPSGLVLCHVSSLDSCKNNACSAQKTLVLCRWLL